MLEDQWDDWQRAKLMKGAEHLVVPINYIYLKDRVVVPKTQTTAQPCPFLQMHTRSVYLSD